MTLIQKDSLVLFIGDSITDCGRQREDPQSLGVGYVKVATCWFQASHSELNVRFLNRGIGGNRTIDLFNRWQSDCLDLKPDWVSILVGINDTWVQTNGDGDTSIEDMERVYRHMLDTARKNLDAQFVLMEPYYLPLEPRDPLALLARADLDKRIHLVRLLAREYSALLVPLDGLFHTASVATGPAYWCPDGVHCSPAGDGLIAQAWLEAVKAI